MRCNGKTKNLKVVLRLIVVLTTSLFVLSPTNALNAKGFKSHKGRFLHAKPIACSSVLENGYFELTGNLYCEQEQQDGQIYGGGGYIVFDDDTLSSASGFSRIPTSL